MEDFIKFDMLFDCYGNLLTDRQKEIASLYYNEDYSYSEIGENLNISRQAVHDSLKTCESAFTSYEEKIGYAKKISEKNNALDRIKILAEEIMLDKDISDDKTKRLKEMIRICEEESYGI